MSNIRGFCHDDETGEVIFFRVNEETGEPVLDNTQPPEATTSRAIVKPVEKKKYTKFPKGITTKSKKFQSLKANILAGSNPISYRMLLIPTVAMIFPGFICVCLGLLEVFLHVRCHRKNKHLKDVNMYYKSPFHAVTGTFCAVCRENDTAWKVGQMQDRRRFRYDYIRSAL